MSLTGMYMCIQLYIHMAFVHKTTVGHPTLESDSLFGLEFSGKQGHLMRKQLQPPPNPWRCRLENHQPMRFIFHAKALENWRVVGRLTQNSLRTNGWFSVITMSSHDDSFHRTTERDGWKHVKTESPNSTRMLKTQQRSNRTIESICVFRCSPTV